MTPTDKADEVVAELRHLAQKWGASEGPQDGRLAIADTAADLIASMKAEREALSNDLRKAQVELDEEWSRAENAEGRAEAAEAQCATLKARLAEVEGALRPLSARCRRLAYPTHPPIFVEIADAVDAALLSTREGGDNG